MNISRAKNSFDMLQDSSGIWVGKQRDLEKMIPKMVSKRVSFRVNGKWMGIPSLSLSWRFSMSKVIFVNNTLIPKIENACNILKVCVMFPIKWLPEF